MMTTNLKKVNEMIINSYVSKINKFCNKDVLNEIDNAENIKDETVDFLQILCERFDYLEESLKRKDRFLNLLFFIVMSLIMLVFLTGCDNPYAHTDIGNNQNKILETNSIYQYQIVCIDGFEYIEGPSRLANKLDIFGKPIPCEVK